MTDNTTEKKPFIDDTRIGEYAAEQPVSGVIYVSPVAVIRANENGRIESVGVRAVAAA